MDNEYLRQFKAKSPTSVIQELFRTAPQCLIEILLRNGACIEGTIIDCSDSFICMRDKREKVSYFSLYEITMVSVLQPKKAAVILSDGAISRPVDEKASITVLALRRWLMSMIASLRIPDFTITLPDELKSVEERLNIRDWGVHFCRAIAEIRSDTLGKEAWSTIRKIELQLTSGSIDISKDQDIILAKINYQKATPSNLTKTLEEHLLEVL